MSNPMREKNEVTRTGGEGDDTCDHGLPRRSPRVKLPTVGVELESGRGDKNKSKKKRVIKS